ncbi:MAG TPA: hypothetical protein DCQ26_10645 [Marinilabiliales bacterium]|nr:MAG: hypothetical protein A2W95_13790 [Bacteroidetes bacterium GWA2_40_14]OFX58267.1 MAG: hypothetical protein A2W84_16380 [Bacteroidetes bacterium GWC2_40_13]OFX72569.1 MAG: hypothetical protein A2W96_04980 [Bacteroidetes bacterium GWD2_40_43]OFX94143.1 MAG: hypothetical protein A2W97_17630 [Bacteroidetes bacterium GWE2_40_63]OFY20295.1 MAG: hypothetical protein A2W88_12600 [Bacteroidetes bacterium GWF2_40_13]OFZ31831.1 MAG: hypothetical protein A2437_07815 [Bacteroidetes bacterium RIFOXYC
MKKSIVSVLLSAILFSCFFLNSCKEENTSNQGKIEFSVINNSTLKSSQSLENVEKIVLTIQHSDGSSTPYTQAEVNLYRMNGIYFTQSLILETGSYQLTEFYLIDSIGNTVYAAPLAGSLQAQNVTQPLPIEFTVSENETTSVNVEVLSTESLTPADFGFVAFPIDEVATFSFLIGIVDKETGVLIPASLTVSNGLYFFSQNLDSIANNMVTIKDSFDTYTLTITHSGYNIFVGNFSTGSLKLHENIVGNLPLVVELEKELTATDYDGNVYHTVRIGNQVWMKENLKATHYQNGDAVLDGTGIGNYSGESEPKYYFNYNDDPSYINPYGRLYTWFAVNDSRNICPVGWHIPSREELAVLADYLGGTTGAGGKLKEAGTTHWDSPNTGATNETGFTALPGGYRGNADPFVSMGYSGCYWASTSTDGQYAWYYAFLSTSAEFFYYPGGTKKDGFSVRCIKD